MAAAFKLLQEKRYLNRLSRRWMGMGTAMAIYRLLAKSPLGPEEIEILVAAYEHTLRVLRLVDRGDPLTELIARKIIEVAQTGLKDPAKISAQAIKQLGIPTTDE
jgi:hypothetical protein